MLYANDEIFNINYNSGTDKLEMKGIRTKHKLRKTLKENKIILIASSLFVLFSLVNCMLIYSFLEILKNI